MTAAREGWLVTQNLHWKAESEQEVELGYKVSGPTHCDLLPAVRSHLLLVPYPFQNVSSAGYQVGYISPSDP